MILNAGITYGEGNELKNKDLLEWVNELLIPSSNLFLKARAFEVRLAIGFYESGNYIGGAKAAKAFLQTARNAIARNLAPVTKLTNAQIGAIEITLAEFLVTEVSVNDDFEESLELLQKWSPLDPNAPSAKEWDTLGKRSRILGKVFKDRGDWIKSEIELKKYLDTYTVKGSQSEGWAAGDLAHVLMETSRSSEAEHILRECLESRRGLQTPKERFRDRRSDTIFLEMQLGECLLLEERYPESEKLLQELLMVFKHFRSSGTLWHFEKFRVFFILTALARLHHLTNYFVEALKYWEQALDYSVTELDIGYQKGNWGRNTFFASIVLLSISDCHSELGNKKYALELQREADVALDECAPRRWVLGLGSYWLKWLREKIGEKVGI
jgi:tetratricopeptide (TPR) repeat protein